MVSTKPRQVEDWDEDYVFVDWGPEFRQGHGQAFPDLKTPAVSVGLGALGLQHVLAHGGTSYFPMRTVRSYLAAGRLFAVEAAPDFRRPAWLVYSQEDGRGDWFRTALDGLRHVASLESED
jgi:DNA-binding transcriptional LysR family regulator